MAAVAATSDTLKLIPEGSARAAAPHFVPISDGVAPPGPEEVPAAYLAALADAGHAADAGAFLLAALPRREAVWLAARCVRSALGAPPLPPAEAALKAAEGWTQAPTDRNRRAAFAAAENLGFDHPAGCVALAAFLSGGSLAPSHLTEVPPPDHAFPKILTGALQLAAVAAGPTRLAETYAGFLALGLAVARGEDRWPVSL